MKKIGIIYEVIGKDEKNLKEVCKSLKSVILLLIKVSSKPETDELLDKRFAKYRNSG